MKANNGETTEELRFYLARKVFYLTADYDNAIHNYLSEIKA